MSDNNLCSGHPPMAECDHDECGIKCKHRHETLTPTRKEQNMKRKRPENLAAVVFVFERSRPPFTKHCVYLDQASNYVDHKEWRHTATIDPAAWIECLLNHPREREDIIDGLRYKKPTTATKP